MSDAPKKKRFLPGRYLIYPEIQLKYAFIFSGIVVITLSFFFVGEFFYLSRGEILGIDPNVIDGIRESIISFNVLVFIISSILTFLVSILITHRFLGPVVAIKRALENYKTGNQKFEIKIRKTDEAHLLVKLLNEYFNGLDEK